jgi:hypothetical protein
MEYRGGSYNALDYRADFPVGLLKPTQSLLQPRVTATSSNMRSDVRLRLKCSKCGVDDDDGGHPTAPHCNEANAPATLGAQHHIVDFLTLWST